MSWLPELSDGRALEYKQRSYAAVPRLTRTLLDVGCGSGDDVLALAERLGSGALVVGVDSCLASIEEALRKARNVALNVRFAVADARCLPFASDGFDVVRADGLFAVVTEPARVARELSRVTAQSGRLLIHDRESALVERGSSAGESEVESDVLGLLKRSGLGSVEITDQWPLALEGAKAKHERGLSVVAHKQARRMTTERGAGV